MEDFVSMNYNLCFVHYHSVYRNYLEYVDEENIC